MNERKDNSCSPGMGARRKQRPDLTISVSALFVYFYGCIITLRRRSFILQDSQ